MKVSIIVPVLNEATNIKRLVKRLKEGCRENLVDLLIVDGGSTDNTAALAREAGATVLQSPVCGRAAQMNYAAKFAQGELLYFVHGDTLPPLTYMTDVLHAVQEGYPIGCFRFRFESDHPLLKVNSYMTRFDRLWCRGGDQTLFVKREIFDELQGYRNEFVIMEEYDFIIRARKKYPFKIIPQEVLVSARKYDQNGYFRVQFANLVVFNMFLLGFSQEKIAGMYKKMLRYRYA